MSTMTSRTSTRVPPRWPPSVTPTSSAPAICSSGCTADKCSTTTGSHRAASRFLRSSRARGPLEPTVIAERLLVTTGTLTSLLDNLERRALIRRQPHPLDRRKLLVDITPAAQAIVDELLPSLHAREQNVISAALSVKEQRELRRLIAKLQQSALQARDAPSPRGAERHRRWTRTAVDAPASNPSSP